MTVINQQNVDILNTRYADKDIYSRVETLYDDFDPKDIMLTSSFAATSAFLLKVFSDIHPDQVIHFIDTGFHFKETLIYKAYLTQLYNLNVVDVQAEDFKHQFTIKDQTWQKDPDLCCTINKVEPLEGMKKNYKVWVSGLMKWQSDFRATLNFFEERSDILKFYPLLDVTKEGRDQFIRDHHLPFHPLKSKGYFSIGCSHCTKPGKDRGGRWNNSPKTECGLHL